MIVKEIIETWLKENGFQGLANSEGPCGCIISDFMPCGEDPSDCEPAYKVKCKGGACEENCEGGRSEYCITTQKPVDETDIIKE